MSEAPERLGSLAVPARLPLPDWPRGWYVAARSRDLPRGGIRRFRLADDDLVLFRTASGALGAVDAFCPHMGAHLAHGRVAGEHLQCALHCWRIGADGVIAGRAERAQAWRVREAHGLVLVELGAGHAPPRAGDGEFGWTGIAPLDVAASWQALMANAFDMPHLCTVHRRALVEPPAITHEASGAFSLRYVSRVTGTGLSDRVMKWLSNDRIDVRLTCHGATLVVETDLGFTRTAAVVGMVPTEAGTRINAAFGVRRGPLLGLRLALTRWLFGAFLRRDLGVVEGMRLRTDVDDAALQSLFDFLRSRRRARR
jgi:nitrite reductase/ring-hydroxylating ferredoxin subunit